MVRVTAKSVTPSSHELSIVQEQATLKFGRRGPASSSTIRQQLRTDQSLVILSSSLRESPISEQSSHHAQVGWLRVLCVEIPVAVVKVGGNVAGGDANHWRTYPPGAV